MWICGFWVPGWGVLDSQFRILDGGLGFGILLFGNSGEFISGRVYSAILHLSIGRFRIRVMGCLDFGFLGRCRGKGDGGFGINVITGLDGVYVKACWPISVLTCWR